MTKPFFENKAFRDEVLGKIKLGRLGQLEELTGAIVFLASRRVVADDRLGAGARTAAGRRSDGLVSRTRRSVSYASGAPQIRDPAFIETGVPASAAHHFVLRCARDTRQSTSSTPPD